MLLDNGIYGLTKKQTSPTTPQGFTSNTQPRGSWLPAAQSALGDARRDQRLVRGPDGRVGAGAPLRHAARRVPAPRAQLRAHPAALPDLHAGASSSGRCRTRPRIALLVHDDGVVVPELEQALQEPDRARPARPRRGAAHRRAPPTASTWACSSGMTPSPATRRRGACRRGPRPNAWLSSTRSSTAMPSDPRTAQALRRWRSRSPNSARWCEGALAQAEAFLAAQGGEQRRRGGARRARNSARSPQARIDAAAFASLFPTARRVDAAGARRDAPRAWTCCAVGERAGRRPVRGRTCRRAARLGAAVSGALARAGRAFGAAMLADLVRGGRYQPAAARPPARRRRVPGLEQGGTPRRAAARRRRGRGGPARGRADRLRATGARSSCSWCAGRARRRRSARCITPGTLVLQTTDGTGLDRVAAFDGPAIAAMMPRGRGGRSCTIRRRGREPWQRLTVHAPARRAASARSAG